jgi:hypothetical protein
VLDSASYPIESAPKGKAVPDGPAIECSDSGGASDDLLEPVEGSLVALRTVRKGTLIPGELLTSLNGKCIVQLGIFLHTDDTAAAGRTSSKSALQSIL